MIASAPLTNSGIAPKDWPVTSQPSAAVATNAPA
jgi:hypothetical protein